MQMFGMTALVAIVAVVAIVYRNPISVRLRRFHFRVGGGNHRKKKDAPERA
jgi:hypothetical protein